MRRSFALVALATSLVVSACGSEGPTEVPKPKPVCVTPQVLQGNTCVTPPPATYVRTYVSGEQSLRMPYSGVAVYRVFEKYSDSTTKDVTMSASWASSNTEIALINSGGGLTPLRLGPLRLTATANGRVATLDVRVVGTPWSELPPISNEAKAFIKAYVLNSNGGLWRWSGDTIKVWLSPAFTHAGTVHTDSALAFWPANSIQKFKLVADSASANMAYTTDVSTGVAAGYCAAGGPGGVQNNRYTTGIVRVRSDCLGSALTYAHEMGHALGLMGHTPSGDLMSTASPSFGMTPLLREIVQWVYAVSPGTYPDDR